jgi:hypothetical protein
MPVQLCVAFPIGSLVRVTALFTRAPTAGEIDDGTASDVTDWQPIDPDTVTAFVMAPDATVTEYEYTGDPVVGVIRDDVGSYHVDLTPDAAGVWNFRFVSTGNGQAASEHRFEVAASVFP